MFGEMEICNVNGPFFLDHSYTGTSTLGALGESTKTENVWHNASAFNADGNEIANLRMMLRILKASSGLYSR